ncbi:MAG: hypothetical protein HY824_14950 [Acidobacteria bacterium]|nr:hypothetical protein [Acidobacteriota bacterium]
MVRLTERRRAILAEKFGDLANYAVAALVFGQAVGQEGFSFGLGLAGFATWLLFVGATFFLAGDDQ